MDREALVARMAAEAMAKHSGGHRTDPDPAPLPTASDTATDPALTRLPIDVLTDFPNQPFKPYTPEAIEQLRLSIVENGILTPLLVRKLEDGTYQILSGHNRRTAARLAGYAAVPCILRTMNDNEALLTVIETNLRQREKLLPSEKAFAYKLKLEAMNRQGLRSNLTPDDLTSCQSGTKLRTDERLADETDESTRQIHRYIRLSYLAPPLLEEVDWGRLGFGVGVTLSYLPTELQEQIYNFFTARNYKIDQRLADRLRELAEEGEELTEERLEEFLFPQNRGRFSRVSVRMKPLRKYFPPSATQKEIEAEIVRILEVYFKENDARNGAAYNNGTERRHGV